MDSFKIYSQSDVLSFVNQRDGETKLGEKIDLYGISDSDPSSPVAISTYGLAQSNAKFVLLGIPEDIGVRANYGIGGAKNAWNATLKAFLNIQSNSFLQGDEILLLGHFEIEEPTDERIETLREKTAVIDKLVAPIIEKIISAGKIPIVIGGGHNNAFPIISGVSKAFSTAINVVNVDAHTDLRNTAEGRHSGNGFSNAIEQGFLGQYRIFGLHQNYLNEKISQQIQSSENINAVFFEDILMDDRNTTQLWVDFTADLPNPCGLEIDLDSIENVLSSAVSPSGFKLNDIRTILLDNKKPFSYLHICEGSIALADGREDVTTGKTIAYLISDFIKALRPHTYPQL